MNVFTVLDKMLRNFNEQCESSEEEICVSRIVRNRYIESFPGVSYPNKW